MILGHPINAPAEIIQTQSHPFFRQLYFPVQEDQVIHGFANPKGGEYRTRTLRIATAAAFARICGMALTGMGSEMRIRKREHLVDILFAQACIRYNRVA